MTAASRDVSFFEVDREGDYDCDFEPWFKCSWNSQQFKTLVSILPKKKKKEYDFGESTNDSKILCCFIRHHHNSMKVIITEAIKILKIVYLSEYGNDSILFANMGANGS